MICECCKKPNTCLHIPNRGAEVAFNQNVLNVVAQTFHRPENSVAILTSVCDLIAALAKEDFTDVSGIGARNFDEHGAEVPRAPLSIAANRRDLIVRYEIKLHYPMN